MSYNSINTTPPDNPQQSSISSGQSQSAHSSEHITFPHAVTHNQQNNDQRMQGRMADLNNDLKTAADNAKPLTGRAKIVAPVGRFFAKIGRAINFLARPIETIGKRDVIPSAKRWTPAQLEEAKENLADLKNLLSASKLPQTKAEFRAKIDVLQKAIQQQRVQHKKDEKFAVASEPGNPEEPGGLFPDEIHPAIASIAGPGPFADEDDIYTPLNQSTIAASPNEYEGQTINIGKSVVQPFGTLHLENEENVIQGEPGEYFMEMPPADTPEDFEAKVAYEKKTTDTLREKALDALDDHAINKEREKYDELYPLVEELNTRQSNFDRIANDFKGDLFSMELNKSFVDARSALEAQRRVIEQKLNPT